MNEIMSPMDTKDADVAPPVSAPASRGADQAHDKVTVARDAIGAVIGAVLGLAPHVLHHVGLVAGTAFVAGAAGSILFFLVGLVLSIPMLARLYRRFHSWRAPAIAVVVFALVFSLTAFLVGPALRGESDDPAGGPSTSNRSQNHPDHHR